MKLHTQLIFLSLLTLALPWAGCEYIREMENTLRQGQAQNLLTTTKTIAHVLTYEDTELYKHTALNEHSNRAENNIYAFNIDSKLLIDGYPDDWGRFMDDLRYFNNQLINKPNDNKVGVLAADKKNYLYLFISVKDKQVIYHDPGKSLINGDRLQLLLEKNDKKTRSYTLQTSAPGKVTATYILNENSLNPRVKKERRIVGQWQDTSDGYNIELRIPKKLMPGHINFSVIDVDDENNAMQGWYGTLDHAQKTSNGLVIKQSTELQAIIEKFKQDNARLRISDRQGWLLSSVGSPNKASDLSTEIKLNETLMAVLNQFYHFIMYFSEQSSPAIALNHGQLSGTLIEQALAEQGNTSWYKPQRSNRAIVTATYPIIIGQQVAGIVIADQSSDAILTLTNYALNRLITLSSVAILLSAVGLLGYATYLSIRIRKLRNATENIISSDGVINTPFKASRAKDELGDLSRSFADMHTRLSEYTKYLRTLASKLSHELRTPLAVVQSSLENLTSNNKPQDTNTYIDRAQQGTERLSNIITAMSEATRVEQSIQTSDAEDFDLSAVIQSSVDAYKDVYPQRQFAINNVCKDCIVHGSPELIVQLLDKLVDNAVDFSTDEAQISVSLLRHNDQAILKVHNPGEHLPANMQHQLFDSMVSLREEKSDKPHMGLGLYVVKLIAEAHRGSVFARNSDDGVEFVVELPVA